MSKNPADPAPGKVSVIGAGMSGLLAAFYLVEQKFTVEVFEKAPEVGGKIQTHSSAHGPMEAAANALLADEEVERVAAKIGIKLLSKKSQARKRWIYRDKQWRRWPLGLAASMQVAGFVLRKKALFSSVEPRSRETLESWAHRNLGVEVTQYLLAPACQGIFGVGPNLLSAKLIYKYFFASPVRKKGKLRGSVAPEAGMGAFPQALKKYLEAQGVVFHLSEESQKAAGPVVLATDLIGAVKYLREQGDARAERLADLPMVDLLSVNAFFKTQAPLSGFGLLFPRSENVEPLGVLINSDIFAGRAHGGTSETWIYGGIHPQELVTDSSTAVLKSMMEAREAVFLTAEAPLATRINRWPQAIVLYGTELEAALEGLDRDQGEIYLMGNYLGELGLNRLFHQARELAARISTATAVSVPKGLESV